MSRPILPGNPPPKLRHIVDDVSELAAWELTARLLSMVSAEWLAQTLRAAGYPVSATTIRTYRRSLTPEDLSGGPRVRRDEPPT